MRKQHIFLLSLIKNIIFVRLNIVFQMPIMDVTHYKRVCYIVTKKKRSKK